MYFVTRNLVATAAINAADKRSCFLVTTTLIPKLRNFDHSIKMQGGLLTWKLFIIFQAVVIGPLHSFTPSLLRFFTSLYTLGNLEGNPHMKRQAMHDGKFEYNS